MRLGKTLGVKDRKAKVKKPLADYPLPVVGFFDDGEALVILKADDERVLAFRVGAEAPEEIALPVFALVGVEAAASGEIRLDGPELSQWAPDE